MGSWSYASGQRAENESTQIFWAPLRISSCTMNLHKLTANAGVCCLGYNRKLLISNQSNTLINFQALIREENILPAPSGCTRSLVY